MSSLDNPFSNTQRSWVASIGIAVLIEGSLAAFLSLGFFGFISAFHGADNPLWFYFAFLLQLPSSLVFIPTLHLAKYFGASESSAFLSAGIVVALLQFAIVALCFRKPWQRRFKSLTSIYGLPPQVENDRLSWR